MYFASDNAGPAHPKVMEALVKANVGYAMPYGADGIMDDVRSKVRDIFEAPEAAVYLVATGTAANSLILGTLANPWDAVFCHRISHVEEDECGAPEFFTDGAKLTLVDGTAGKMDPVALTDAIEATGTKGVHGVQRGPVTLTQCTEVGTVYTLAEIESLTAIARQHNLKTHLDGARFSNALAALNCSAADMTWRAGIDAVSFGGTKNGLLGVEAVVLFDPDLAWQFELRRKRGAHLFSKHRYLSAQMQAYLTDDLWLQCAKHANNNMARLVEGLRQIDGVQFQHEPGANMLFAHMPRALHRRAIEGGAKYYLMPFTSSLEGPDDELIGCRFVCDWSLAADRVDDFLRLIS